MIPQVVVLETLIRRAPLGLRFVDLARNVTVTDGLLVTARPLGAPSPTRQAVHSPVSGIYGFRTLPGLSRYESGEAPAAEWCASPPYGGASGPSDWVISVEDQQRRFLPQRFVLCLPREQLVEVPLFSAPSRSPPGGFAVVRGELQVRTTETPAAWALVTGSLDGTPYSALADERGMFVLFLPYASALPPLIGSPPHGATPLDQLTWSLTVEVLYQPGRQDPLDVPGPPDSRSIIEQARATVYDTPTLPGPSVTRSLRFGQPLVVATADRSRLLVDPA